MRLKVGAIAQSIRLRPAHLPWRAVAKPKHLGTGLLSSCAAFLLLATGPVAVHADDYVIDQPTGIQNNGHVIDGDDSLTITGDGAVTTDAPDMDAVLVQGDNNTVQNHGRLVTKREHSRGITVLEAITTFTTTARSSPNMRRATGFW